MRIKTKVKSDWYEFKDIKLFVRPFPFSAFDIQNIDGALFKQFEYCVTDWKGLTDEDDKALKCDSANKKLVYDYVAEIRDFVFDILNKSSEMLDKQEKN